MKFSALSDEAKYNVLCDGYATEAVEQESPTELPYPGSGAMLKINDEWITSNYEQQLTKSATASALENYIKDKLRV